MLGWEGEAQPAPREVVYREKEEKIIMKCSNCGKENLDGGRFCAECGTALPTQNPLQSQVQYVEITEQNLPPEYKPISMWGYFGYQLLFSIPCVGIIVLVIFAFGGSKNQNVRNFARSYFCYMILMVLLVAIIVITGLLERISY